MEEPLRIRLGESDVAITMRTPGHDRGLALGSVIVSLVAGLTPDIDARRFYVTSSCGICGKASIDALAASGCAMLPAGQPKISANLVPHFPAKLREAQAIFEHTGGLHAAGPI